jgi:hypothetical protein
MIEVYVILALGAFGYLLNSLNNNVKPKKLQVNKFELPSMNNIYDSNYSKKAEQTDMRLAQRAYKEALAPKKTNRIMTMAGQMVDEDAFQHTNMEPYFGGTIRQNMDVDRNRVLLENFTGVSDIPKQKCEVKSFYDQSKDMGNVFGMANNDEYYRDRIEQPRLRNNEVPIAQIRVGPGLNKGYAATPVGGFQQLEAGEIARQAQKCVNDLRVKSNPKESFAARIVDGQKEKLPGEPGKISKNRVETFTEQTPEQYLKTTGANLKPSQVPQFNVKPTNRLSTSKEYSGPAHGANKRRVDGGVKDTSRQQLGAGGIRNAVLNAIGLGQKDDYGKGNIVVYNNERDLTTTRTYQGNITSLIKSIIAPIEDAIKVTKKQEHVDNPRQFGYLSAQMPDKETIRPDDEARTTLKEQLVHDSVLGNLRGKEKISIYNDDEARTTLKEQLIHDDTMGNLRGKEKISIYNDDEARTTLKEQLIHDDSMGNLKPAGPSKLTIYDPNDVARTTIAETLLHDEIGTGTITGPKELYTYDPDEVAKKTIRETLYDVDYSANVSTTLKRQTLQLDDEIRTTLRETLIDNLYTGQANAKEAGGAYETTEYDAKTVQKQFLADIDHFGQAGRDKGEGYATNEMEAKQVQRAYLADNDYFGGAEASTDKKQMSYEDFMNAHVDERKEVLLSGRDPTNSGVKSFNADVSMRIRKPQCDEKAERKFNNMDRVYNNIPQMSDRQITRTRLAVDLDPKLGYDRIDPDLLKVFRENVYTQPLNSVA